VAKNNTAKVRGTNPSPASAGAEPVKLAGWVLPGMDYPTYRLSLVGKAMNRITVRKLSAANELTYAEWRVLSRLATAAGGATIRQLAETSWADRAEVSRAASQLEERSLVERRDNPEDRRMPILSLTKAGRRKYEALVGERAAFHEALIGDLSDNERATLDRILGKIALRLESMK
jgi:DNA-binding MarR family transcriptional regulator